MLKKITRRTVCAIMLILMSLSIVSCSSEYYEPGEKEDIHNRAGHAIGSMTIVSVKKTEGPFTVKKEMNGKPVPCLYSAMYKIEYELESEERLGTSYEHFSVSESFTLNPRGEAKEDGVLYVGVTVGAENKDEFILSYSVDPENAISSTSFRILLGEKPTAEVQATEKATKESEKPAKASTKKAYTWTKDDEVKSESDKAFDALLIWFLFIYFLVYASPFIAFIIAIVLICKIVKMIRRKKAPSDDSTKAAETSDGDEPAAKAPEKKATMPFLTKLAIWLTVVAAFFLPLAFISLLCFVFALISSVVSLIDNKTEGRRITAEVVLMAISALMCYTIVLAFIL